MAPLRGGTARGGRLRAGAGRVSGCAIAPAAWGTRSGISRTRCRGRAMRRRGAVGPGLRGRPPGPRRRERARRKHRPPAAGLGIRGLQLRRRPGPGEPLPNRARRRSRDRGDRRGGAPQTGRPRLLCLGARQSRSYRGRARDLPAAPDLRLRRPAASRAPLPRALPLGPAAPSAHRFRPVGRNLPRYRELGVSCEAAAAGGARRSPRQGGLASRLRILARA